MRGTVGKITTDSLNNNPTKISWSETLKKESERGVKTEFEAGKIRTALYRPFTKQFVYFDADWTERRYQQPSFLLRKDTRNSVIVVTDVGTRSPFSVMATDQIKPEEAPRHGPTT